MLFYNQITEVVFWQDIILVLIEFVIISIAIFIFKKKLTKTAVISSILIALIFSLLSLNIVQGGPSGMNYFESLGWPIQYRYVWRSMETATPFNFSFSTMKFFVNTLIWGCIPLMLSLEFLNRSKHKNYRIFTFTASFVFILLVVYFSYYNSRREQSLRIEKPALLLQITDPDASAKKK